MIASFELEGIVSSSIVTLSSDTGTMSALAVEADKSVCKVAGGDSLARRAGKSASNLTQGEISFETRETMQLSTELCLQVYRP